MFFVQLRFSTNKDHAGQFMKEHNAWIQRGFDEGVFLLVGGLQPNLGGGIVAHATTRAELERRVDADPFVAHGIVDAEIAELTPAKADERLGFLLG